MSLVHVLCLAVLVAACAPETTPVGLDVYIPSGNLEANHQQPVSARYVAPPPDMAAPADMAPPQPRPDLAPLPVVIELPVGAWTTSGAMTTTTVTETKSGYHCAKAFDFVKVAAIVGVVEAKLQLPPEALKAKQVEISDFALDADLSWGAPAPLVCGTNNDQLVHAETGTQQTCLHPSWGAGLAENGVAVSPIRNGVPSKITARPQLGRNYPVEASSQVTLRLELVGDVDVANLRGTATATLWF